MKISIDNFKAIKSLPKYELKPLTILSGVNSSGKSSFIQLLLLLKQTLELDSTKFPLVLDGDLYQVNRFQDILTGKKLENRLKIAFEFNREEDIQLSNNRRLTLFDSYKTYTINVEINFDLHKEQIYISDFEIKYLLPTGDKKEQFVKFSTTLAAENKFKIEANNFLFGDELWAINQNFTDLKYSSIFPNYYEITELSVEEGTKKDGENVHQQNTERYFPKIDGIKSLMEKKFSSISYIGPAREAPRDFYPISSVKQHVGKDGEFTAQLLENFGNDSVEFLKPTISQDQISYQKTTTTLIQAVKYWMCDIFKIGEDIYSKKQGEAYIIYLKNFAQVETTIKHVGFGISQVLPIIVEGLLMPVGGTLILEQPEIHLHPKIQSLLFDFLYGLVLEGKNVIIETHSDHFITRMRRRIAENKDNSMASLINLTFVEPNKDDLYFEIIELDDMGTSDYFPDDFIEQSNVELKAIVNAQMKKRSNTK